jgi:hypothetical protein
MESSATAEAEIEFIRQSQNEKFLIEDNLTPEAEAEDEPIFVSSNAT